MSNPTRFLTLKATTAILVIGAASRRACLAQETAKPDSASPRPNSSR